MTIIPRNGGGGNALGLPLGGTTGQKLVKASGIDGDAEWIDDLIPPPVPPSPGDVPPGGGTLGWDTATGTYIPISFFGVAVNAVARYVADRGTSTTTPGAEVTQWDDQVTAGLGNLTRLGGGTGPTYEIDGEDGVPMLRFTAAANSFLRKNPIANPNNQLLSILAVIRLNTPASNARVVSLCANGQTTTNERSAGLVARQSNNGIYTGIHGRGVGGANFSARSTVLGSGFEGPDARTFWTVILAVFKRISFPGNWDMCYAWDNGDGPVSALTSPQAANAFQYVALGVGGQIDAGADTMNNPADFDIRELTIWQRALSFTEATIERRRAAQTWNVPLIS